MTTPSGLEHVQDVPVQFEAVLAGPAMSLRDLLKLTEGSLVRTLCPAGETVEVFAAGALIGSAELTDADGRRAVRMVRFHAGGR